MRILYLPNEYSQQRQKEKKRYIYPVLLAMESEWWRSYGYEVKWNEPDMVGWADKIVTEPEGLPFLSLPKPDRKFTHAMDKMYRNNGII